MGEPYFKWVALYLWGEVIDFGRTRHPEFRHPLPRQETPGRYIHTSETPTPIGHDAVFLSSTRTG